MGIEPILNLNDLEKHIQPIATEVLERQIERQFKDLKLGDEWYHKSLADAVYNLRMIKIAVEHSSLMILVHYLKWLDSILKQFSLPDDVLTVFLTCAKEVLDEKIEDKELRNNVQNIIINAKKELEPFTKEPQSFIRNDNPHSQLLYQYYHFVMEDNKKAAKDLINNAVNNGTALRDIYLYVFQPFQYEIGRLWQLREISVAKEHYCTAVTQLILSSLYDIIFSGKNNKKCCLTAACVEGELHEMGIRMVADYLESEQFDTHYLGANTPISDLVAHLKTNQPKILALSATMFFNIAKVKTLIHKLHQDELATKIIVGGFPFSIDPELWKKVGADACSHGLADVEIVINNLLKE
ncbi:MAG: cobalamin-dependent protein [Spirochaetes bacterium]|nr:cobalamin-dependent protein [Spirochaetota bacterium]